MNVNPNSPVANEPERISLSVYFITKNEEDRIAKSLARVIDWVDEVIVVDSGSTDSTCEIAAAMGARVVFHEWRGYAEQKAYAASLCRNDWVLDLDADEILSAELIANIQREFNPLPDKQYGAFEFEWKTVLPLDDSPRLGGKSSWILRLYHREMAQIFVEGKASIKDRATLKSGEVGRLDGVVFHHSFRDFSDIERKWSALSRDQAENFLSLNRPVSSLRVFLEFPTQFVKFYFFRRMFMWGWYGYVLAIMSAYRQMMRFAKYRELKEQK